MDHDHGLWIMHIADQDYGLRIMHCGSGLWIADNALRIRIMDRG